LSRDTFGGGATIEVAIVARLSTLSRDTSGGGATMEVASDAELWN
jgi:hypothetical protein